MAVGGALFGSGRNSNANSNPNPRALVQFKAGKMTLNPSDKMVTADKRKGLVIVEQTDDHLMHFKWKERGKDANKDAEDDLIIFPDDVEFKKVACTDDRVFILKFKSSSRKMFFWMQEPKDDKDEDLAKKVNDYLNHPPAPGSLSRGASSSSGGGGSGGAIDLNNLGDSELQSLLNNMSQQQLMQLFGGGGGGLASLLGGGLGGGGGSSSSSGRQRSSQRAAREAAASSASAATSSASTSTSAPTTTTSSTSSSTSGAAATATTTTTTSSVPPIKLADLQNILSGIQVPGGAEGGASGGGPEVNLASGITAEVMRPLLANKDFVKKMKELLH